ncbi:MAG: alpha/beta hydrolase [Gammaproteobacteria bacterium]|nr:MAG: alpha/beta hydrolase [Gammaproteobacteria bacterium]
MKLHHTISGTGQPLIILHGLFGSSDNWRVLAKKLANHVQVITVDLRNHGSSPHSEAMTYRLMADDLKELLDELSLDKIDLIGHSIGGKVAMEFSQHYSQRLNKLAIIDIAPKQYAEEHTAIFTALLAIDLTQYSSRSEVDAILSTSIRDKAVRQFLLMNLAVSNTGLAWRINLVGLRDNYPHLLQAVCGQNTIHTPSYFLRGGKSSYIKTEDYQLIQTRYSTVEIETIEQAGHWVHAEAPDEFLSKISEFFNYD